jgi:hypothetical protein
VDHQTAANSAALTLGAPISSTDGIGAGPVPVNNLDEYGNLAEANDITESPEGCCPNGLVALESNEAAGSKYVLDSQGFITDFLANNPALAQPGDGILHVDGASFTT